MEIIVKWRSKRIRKILLQPGRFGDLRPVYYSRRTAMETTTSSLSLISFQKSDAITITLAWTSSYLKLTDITERNL